MSLTPEEQERKAENQKRNLLNQTLPVIDRSNQGSFKTRRRYKAVMNRFCGYLGENTTLQNFRNVEVRHVRNYVEHLQINGCKPGYILTELSGIKWVHQRMNPKRNLPKSNKCFFVAKRQLYIKDKSILPHEFDDLIKVALDMGRMDAVIEAYMDRYFGLRHEEFVTLRVHQIEYALKYKQLNLTNTKGGRPRDIPVETKMQENILRRVLVYAQKNGKSSMDYVICDNHTNSVKKKSKSLDNWMNNNKKKFMDPERTKYKSPGKRPREQSIHWHSLRHLFYQETKERYKAEGKMTDAQIERELSESMGHSRNDVNNTYSNEIKRIH